MYLFIFLLAAIFTMVHLVTRQQLGHRTLFEPGCLITIFFLLSYLLPSLAINFGIALLPETANASLNTISIYGTAFLLAFYLFYTRTGNWLKIFNKPNPKPLKFGAGHYFTIYCFLFIALKVILIFYGVTDADDYTGQYAIRALIPHFVAQLINLFGSLLLILMCIVIALSLSQVTKSGQSYYMLGIGALLIIDMLITKSRMQFMIYFVVLGSAYGFYGRQFDIRRELISAAVLIVLMSLVELERVKNVGSLTILDVVIPSEFISVFRNAYHIASIEGTPDFLVPPGSSYLQALISFIPKQINQDKWDLNSWYVSSYFPDFHEAGGGLAFGIIPEAIVNYGILSIIFQAFVLALVIRSSLLQANRYTQDRPNIWVILYLFSFSQLYQCIRSDSFAIISGLFYGFLLPFLIIRLIDFLMISLRKISTTI